jgi:hypothetical protein
MGVISPHILKGLLKALEIHGNIILPGIHLPQGELKE